MAKTVIWKTWKGTSIPKEPKLIVTKTGIWKPWKGTTTAKTQVGKVTKR